MTEPFWGKGLHFQCQHSGCCCSNHGDHTYVYLSLDDRRRVAAHLGERTSAFTRRHCFELEGPYSLLDAPSDCGCSVYEARPTQCRTWPFWPENMTPNAWQKDVATLCPGVGKGKLHSREEIEAQLELADD